MKMKVIKMTRLNGEDVFPEEIVDLDKDLAESWERARLADKIPEVENARLEPVEKAVKDYSGRGRRPKEK